MFAKRGPTVAATETTVCEIVEHPLQFNGKLVRVHAEAFGVEIDNPVELLDQNCKEYYLAIEFPKKHPSGYQVRKLQKAIAPPRRGNISYHGRSATGTFVGTIYYAWLVKGGVDLHFTVEGVPELVVPPLPSLKRGDPR